MKKILVTLFLCASSFSFSQNRIGITTGIGLPDFIYAGGKYQHKQFEVGLQVGSMPSKTLKLLGVGSHFMWHFAGTSKHLEARPWYAKGHLVYNYDETSARINHLLFSGLSVGREFALSERLSLQLDLGVTFITHEKRIELKPVAQDWSIGMTTFPAGSFTVFYSFNRLK